MKTRKELQPEPLWYLKALAHSAYLQTDHWRLRRERFLAKRDPRCDFCELTPIDEVLVEDIYYLDQDGNQCSPRKKDATETRSGCWIIREPKWHVHHLTYEHIGEERDSDLELLCAPCHYLKHYPTSAAARHWTEIRGHRFTGEIPDERPDPCLRGFIVQELEAEVFTA